MSAQLTERQENILASIQESLGSNGYPPTIRELGEKIGVKSTSLITYYLEQLEALGYITRDRSISRGIRLTGQGEQIPKSVEIEQETIAIPYLGYIVASEPIAVEALSGDETLELNRALFGRNVANLYALTVKGDSMIDALIHQGDTIILRHQERVENGEMAAVWVDDPGETTLKKVYYEGSRVRLQPANPTMKPIYVPAGNLRIQGKVVMVIRKLE
ncbi:MAG: transcriptional repressor LexA [Anaerolineae bacterium]|jgi:repressor LexA|nr:transcriptional repressor LexA [Anaerolineae bacterium]